MTQKRRKPARKPKVTQSARRVQDISLEITGLSHDGAGIARLDGMAVFVPGAFPGDKVVARVVQTKTNMARAELIDITHPSPDRVESPCAVSHRCGGCTFCGVRYEAQVEWKTRAVRDAIYRIAGLKDVNVRACMGAREPERYRNKAQFPVAIQRGKVVAGCYAKGTHDVVATDHCLIQHEYNDIIVKEALQLISQFGLSVYDERRGTGLVRHVMGRVAPGTGECIAVIVTSSRKFPRAREFAKALMARVPQLVGVVQNINPEKTNIILGKDTRILEGRGYVDDLFGNERIGTLRFRISPLSFYQVNTEQAARLYEKALDYADLRRWETAIDLYSGIGTITLFLAQKCSSAIGIEEVFEAVKDARQNQKLNGIRNASFVNGRAERVLPSVLARTGVQPNVIVLDPPRKGCDPLLLSTLARARPERVVYISCYPPTLARDLAVLHKHGYATIEVQPIDLFPYTSHVETVALVSRR